jgi:hypothetical protein
MVDACLGADGEMDSQYAYLNGFTSVEVPLDGSHVPRSPWIPAGDSPYTPPDPSQPLNWSATPPAGTQEFSMSIPATPGRETDHPTPSTDSGPSPTDSSSHRLQAAVTKEEQRRRANSIAAQNYRRRRTSKVAKLEQELQVKSTENNDLKWRLAAAEREIQVLRELLTGAPTRRLPLYSKQEADAPRGA